MKPIILCLAGTIAALAAEPEPAGKAAADQTAAKVSATLVHLKQVSLVLYEFDTEYGAFPDDETAEDVMEATGTRLSLTGKTSNDYFRQIIASGVKSEKIFQFGKPAKPADDVSDTNEKALEKGECDFAYVVGLDTARDPGTPVVLGPLVPGKLVFDPLPLGGKAVVLRVGSSAAAYPITPEGDVIIDGKSIFDPAQPFWNGRKPVVAWPK